MASDTQRSAGYTPASGVPPQHGLYTAIVASGVRARQHSRAAGAPAAAALA